MIQSKIPTFSSKLPVFNSGLNQKDYNKKPSLESKVVPISSQQPVNKPKTFSNHFFLFSLHDFYDKAKQAKRYDLLKETLENRLFRDKNLSDEERDVLEEERLEYIRKLKYFRCQYKVVLEEIGRLQFSIFSEECAKYLKNNWESKEIESGYSELLKL